MSLSCGQILIAIGLILSAAGTIRVYMETAKKDSDAAVEREKKDERIQHLQNTVIGGDTVPAISVEINDQNPHLLDVYILSYGGYPLYDIEATIYEDPATKEEALENLKTMKNRNKSSVRKQAFKGKSFPSLGFPS